MERLLDAYRDHLEAAFIVTPHALHHDQAKMCLEAGLDVLLEKPMVINAIEARSLIESRDQHKIWNTIGVSEDIIEASWQALADSFQYKLAYEETYAQSG